MAPGKRADNKKGICIYVDAKIIEAYKAFCAAAGKTMAESITAHMSETVKRCKKEN